MTTYTIVSRYYLDGKEIHRVRIGRFGWITTYIKGGIGDMGGFTEPTVFDSIPEAEAAIEAHFNSRTYHEVTRQVVH